MNDKINHLIEVSKKVISDCSLENGALVAANPTKPYYPPTARNYFYVWVRDGSYTCIAAQYLGLQRILEPFFDWFIQKAEGFKDKGLFYKNYDPNGSQAHRQLQFDQTGTVLYVLGTFCKNQQLSLDKYQQLLLHSSKDLCKLWDENHFSVLSYDLWEGRRVYPDLEENFMYSLASCIKGLETVNSLLPNELFQTTTQKMRDVLLTNAQNKGYFFRSFGKLNDERIDASLLGLIWPFGIVEPTNPLALKTVEIIEDKLVKDCGVYRFEQDEYDGWVYQTMHRNKGSGFWPLLNFWMSIVLNKMGRKDDALKYYTKVINSVEDYIPEQIFNNNIQQSISPLCWSHAMFVLASKELGYI